MGTNADAGTCFDKNINSLFLVYHNQFPTDDYQWPRYEQYVIEFDADFAADIAAQFTYLFATYFDGYEPPVFADGFESE